MARIPYYPTTTEIVTSTSAPLDASGTFSTDVLPAVGLTKIVGSVYADQAGTIYIEQSADRDNWDVSTSYAVLAEDGKGIDEEILLPYVRVRYVNGDTDQTEFRLNVQVR